MYTAITMGVVIILIVSALIIMITLFIGVKIKLRVLQQIKPRENIPIYDDIAVAEIINPKMNVAYEKPSLPERHHTMS